MRTIAKENIGIACLWWAARVFAFYAPAGSRKAKSGIRIEAILDSKHDSIKIGCVLVSKDQAKTVIITCVDASRENKFIINYQRVIDKHHRVRKGGIIIDIAIFAKPSPLGIIVPPHRPSPGNGTLGLDSRPAGESTIEGIFKQHIRICLIS